MAGQVVLIAVLIVVATAAAVPYVWLERNRWRPRREATALVLGGGVLGGGQGAIAFGLFAAAGDIEPWWFLMLPLLIIAAARLALWAVSRLNGWARRGLLLAAAVLSGAGSLAGGLFVLAGFAALLAAVCYLLAIADRPREFLRRLDPRD